jgi:Galactose mutarotase and related enzymes
MKIAAAALVLPLMSQAANYSAKTAQIEGVDAVLLADAAHKTEVTVLPSVGNIAYRMLVNGKNALWDPYDKLSEMKAKPVQAGVPFLEPWANRLDQDSYYANGKKYRLNPDLANFRRDGNRKPIHGLLSFSPLWRVIELHADHRGAWVTSRLEFWKYPDLIAQFPFAHTIEMTYRLVDGVLEVETSLLNHSTEPMPVAIGYHPYFQVHDAPRDEWTVHLAARDKLTLSSELIPTGERTPVQYPDPLPLKGATLDDVFSNLIAGADGRPQFSVQGKKEKVTVSYGPKYTVAVVYAPGKSFICFEPMSAITNAFNLAHAGIYKELQSIPPGGQWRESFWISTSGF